MDESKVARLIEEVHDKPIIWNKTLSEYKNQIKKGHEWNKVAATLNVSKSTAQNKWKSLVKTFKTEHSRVQSHRSGDGLENAYQSSWPYYLSLTFLTNCAVANSSTGNLDFAIDEKPLLTASSFSSSNSDLKTLSTDSTMYAKPTSSMTAKRQYTVDHLVEMENKKYALVQNSLMNNEEIDETAEVDKLNMSFFETLLPPLRQVSREDILLCRNDLSRVVFSYAYKNATWKSLNDKNDQETRNTVQTSKRRLPTPQKRRFNEDDDDDCQIVGISLAPPQHVQSTIPIKKEKKYQPSRQERYVELMNYCNNDIAMPRFGYNCYACASGTVANWNNQYYEQKMTPEYPAQKNFEAIGSHSLYTDGGRPVAASNIYPPNTVGSYNHDGTFQHGRNLFRDNVHEVSQTYDKPSTVTRLCAREQASPMRHNITVGSSSGVLFDAHEAIESETNKENRLPQHANLTDSDQNLLNVSASSDNSIQNNIQDSHSHVQHC